MGPAVSLCSVSLKDTKLSLLSSGLSLGKSRNSHGELCEEYSVWEMVQSLFLFTLNCYTRGKVLQAVFHTHNIGKT